MTLWSAIIDFVLKTQQNYLNLSYLQFEWLKKQLYIIYNSNIGIYNKYKSLVFLNRFLKCGRYCLIFNSKIEKYTIDLNSELLFKLFENPIFEELNLLSDEDKSIWLKLIDNHILAHNLYIDRQILSQNQSYYSKKIDFINLYCECYKEVTSENLIFKNNTTYLEPKNKSKYIMLTIDYMFLILENKIKDDSFEDILKVCSNALKLGYIHKYNL
jgi:hypothetical protein